MKNIIVKVNNATQTIEQHKVVTQDGQPTVIKASDKVNYELIDRESGRAPNHLITKRVSKDLHISFDVNGKDSDLIIEGYYEGEVDSALIGQAEDGSYYYYVPDTGEVVDYVTELAPGDVEGQALGGNAHSTPYWVGAAEDSGMGILPWLVGLAGLGALIAALDDDDDKDTTPPTKPDSVKIGNGDDYITVDEIDDSGNVSVTVDLPSDAAVGDTVVVNDKEKTITQADKDAGEVIIDVPAPTEGEKLEVEATIKDQAGNESDPVKDEATRDTSIPGDVDGDGSTTDPNDPTQGDDGDTDNKDADGNPTADTTTIKGAPIITFPEDQNGDGKLNIDENGETPDTTLVRVTTPVKTEVGDTVYIKVNDAVEPIKKQVTKTDIDNGYVTVDMPVADTNNDGKIDDITVEAFVKDPAGNQSHTATKKLEVDLDAPEPTLSLNKITGDNVLTLAEIKETLKLEGKVTGEFNADDIVTINVNNTSLTTKVAADGTFSVDVAGSELASDEDTIITASFTTKDEAGNSSTVTDKQDFIVQPTISLAKDTKTLVDNSDGSDNDDGSDKDNISSDGTLNINSYGDEIVSVVVTTSKGDTVIGKNGEGKFVLDEGTYTEVTVTTKDSTNTTTNSFGPVVIDQTNPSAPVIEPRIQNKPVFDGPKLPDDTNFLRMDPMGSTRIESSKNTDTVILKFRYTDETFNTETDSIGVTHTGTVIKKDNTWKWLDFDGVAATDTDFAVQSGVLLESVDLNDDGSNEAVVTITYNRLLDGSDITATNIDTAGNVSEGTTKIAADDDDTEINYTVGGEKPPTILEKWADFQDVFEGKVQHIGFLDESDNFTKITKDGVFEFDVTRDANDDINGYGFKVLDAEGPANDASKSKNEWPYELIAFDSGYNQIYVETLKLVEVKAPEVL